MRGIDISCVITTLFILWLSKGVRTQNDWVSPCPKLFTYDTASNEKGKWYGIVTLLSDSDLSGVWLRLIFDRPSIQLGNWFGQVDSTDNKEYLVKNRNHKIKAGTPFNVRFYIQYDESEPPPKFVGFRLNAKVLCPEGAPTTPAPIAEPQLMTSGSLGPTRPPVSREPPVQKPLFVQPSPPPTQGPVTSGNDDDDYFPGDFGLIKDPNKKPSFNNVQCGTVVKTPSRYTREAQYYSSYPSYTSSNYNSNSNNNGWLDSIIKYLLRLDSGQNTNKQYEYEIERGYPTQTTDVPKGKPRPLITSGEDTNEGEFPWHSALYHARGIDLAYICGGSLISKSHVITVAHCVTRRKSNTPLNPENLVVYLGKYYLKRWSNPGIQDRQVSKIIAHPQYNADSYHNDIAMLKLAKPVEFTDYVRPICLWEGSNDINTIINQLGTVVGWGFDETGRVTEKLFQAKMPVVSKETCIYSFPEFFSRFTTEKTYCAGFRNGTSVCNGDSGGGMIFPKSNIGRPVWQLRGLVSISVALQNQFTCDSNQYVVFTDAVKYQDWINQSLRT